MMFTMVIANILLVIWAAARQSWGVGLSFTLEIRAQISAQTENIFIFCFCRIWIQICRVLTVEHYLYIDQKCWIPLGMLPKTLNHNMYVERDYLKINWFNSPCFFFLFLKVGNRRPLFNLFNNTCIHWLI